MRCTKILRPLSSKMHRKWCNERGRRRRTTTTTVAVAECNTTAKDFVRFIFSPSLTTRIFSKGEKKSIFYASTTDAEMKQNYFARSSSHSLALSAFSYVRAFNFTNEGVIRAQNTQETHKTNNNFSLDAHNNRTILKTQLRRCSIHGFKIYSVLNMEIQKT